MISDAILSDSRIIETKNSNEFGLKILHLVHETDLTEFGLMFHLKNKQLFNEAKS